LNGRLLDERKVVLWGVSVTTVIVAKCVSLVGTRRLCQGVNLRAQPIADRGHKRKVPTNQAAYDQYLDLSISSHSTKGPSMTQ